MINKIDKGNYLKKLDWFRKHWIISIIFGLVVLCIIGSVFDSGKDVDEKQGDEIEQTQNSVNICNPNWECFAWSECSSSGIQTRRCSDRNNCNSLINLPSQSQLCTPPKVYIQKTYNDLCIEFDLDSQYTSLQKEKIFEEDYKEKYAEWTGKITNIDASILNNLRLYVTMSCGTAKIYMNQDQYDKLILLNKKDIVTFNGNFDAQPTGKLFGGVNFVLEDGELV